MQIYREQCYGCGACSAVCPHDAIRMADGADGQRIPQIDPTKCTHCGFCSQVCPDRIHHKSNRPDKAYAAVCEEKKLLRASASGGAFAALANGILSQDGVVFGSAMPEGEKRPRHIMIESVQQISQLQGSKYAQSETCRIYPLVKQKIKQGVPVLFSGTPCQVAGLRGYLQGKEYKNLLTVDLICHGVPSGSMLESYLEHLEQREHIQVKMFSFRGKQEGWGKFRFSMRYNRISGQERQLDRPANRSSYYWLFLKGATYRESCYHCPYACMERVSDLTIGDWWGIQEAYPDYIGKESNQLDPNEGISCVLVNTKMGENALEKYGCLLKLLPTDPDAVANGNRQLRQPQVAPEFRDAIMELYKNGGYPAVEQWYQKRLGWKGKLRRLKDRMCP